MGLEGDSFSMGFHHYNHSQGSHLQPHSTHRPSDTSSQGHVSNTVNGSPRYAMMPLRAQKMVL